MSIYISYEQSELTGKEAVERSAELMEGNIWSLFCLNLSFIGWVILSFMTFGIGFLWLIPYVQVSEFHFYRDLSGDINYKK